MFRFTPLVRFAVLVLGLTLLQPSAPLCAQGAPTDRSEAAGPKFKIDGTIVSSLTGMPLGQARVSLIDTELPLTHSG